MTAVAPRLSRLRPRGRKWFLFAVVLLALTKLWLVASQTVYAIGTAGHDDRLFLSLADHIARGDWLGPYNELTLAKGPFYPIWIAFSYLLHVPLLLSEQLLYLAACAVATLAVRPMVRRLPWLLAIFAFLLFNPMSMDSHVATRIIREGIYPALTLLSVGTAIGLLLRRQLPIARFVTWAMACGLALAAFWLTREEGVWLLVFLAPLLAWTAFRLWRTAEPAWAKIAVCALPVLIPFAAVQAVSLANQRFYDVYTAVDFNTPEFKAAYGALSRVKHADWVPRVPVPREARLRIYDQSPAFAELKPFFEQQRFWTRRILVGKKNPDGIEDIPGAWFMWALRDAASGAGYYRSGSTSAAYFKRLAKEINTACKAQRLECLPKRASMMPPWRAEYVEPVLRVFSRALHMLVHIEPWRVAPIPSSGSEGSLALFARMTRDQLSPLHVVEAGKPIFVRALAAHASARLRISLVDEEGQVLARADAKPSPEVERYFTRLGLALPAHADQARFELRSRCKKGCRLQVEAEDRVLARAPLRKGQTAWFSDPLWIYIQDIDRADPLSVLNPVDKVKLRILAQVGRSYQIGLPALVVLALLVFGFHTWQLARNRTLSDVWVVSSLLVATVVGRALILSLIDAMAFPAINPTYLAPAYPLVMLSVALMLVSPFVGATAAQPAGDPPGLQSKAAPPLQSARAKT